MRRGTRERNSGAGRAGVRAVLSAAVLAAVLASGCSVTGSGPDGRTPSGRPSGGTGAGPVLAVKVDNVGGARPQTGLETADVIYVEPVEAGLSRLMAIYATRLPHRVGPVRSARESDLELLRQFDRPELAFSGAQSALLPLIDAAPLRARTPEKAPGAYERDGSRPAPHNLYVRPGRLLPAPAGAAGLTTGFSYGEAPAGGRAASSRSVRYPAAGFTFTWSGERHRWLVDMDGSPARTAGGEPLAPATVVVQHVRVRASRFQDFRGSNSPYTESVGAGRAEVLRDGRAYEATWRRPAAGRGTAFTDRNGAPVNFAEGQVWVVFAPDS
ncbi:DUF3048 domain-containing protein [Streptomyces sp. SID8352]|uniref:DUF3048 domain-containing protein n=1 Tax=Streptomyces sp. SID8352 TaxID=2690338 RepID=UPI00136DD04A|nr:DUF3048 domain-containing protein [Streptomyces sp. SID8352]MYU23969.1 DUF3048 domain-containing protein [Streptomyces sp. SID8352]